MPNDQDECCKVVFSATKSKCPACGAVGKSVSSFTVSLFLRDPRLYLHEESLPPGSYYMCETRSCPTVYFTDRGVQFSKTDIRVKVWQKEDDPKVPACYCFDNSVVTIQNEIIQTGGTDVISRIGAEVRAGNCRCEVTNPQGSCCLGNVTKAVKIAKENLSQPAPVVSSKKTNVSLSESTL
jgi:hypothetical protein